MITQEQLARLHAANVAKRAAVKEYEKLRDEVMDDLDRRHRVEPGPLDVALRTSVRQAITQAHIEKILGKPQLALLKASVKQNVVRYITVTDSDTGKPLVQGNEHEEAP